MKPIIQKYIVRYLHLETLIKDEKQFAQNAMLLSVPPGVTGIELLELSKMAQPKRGGWHNSASAENGKKGGRPKKSLPN